MKQADEVKVAIHTVGWVTKDGFTCRSWSGYRVAVGRNPFGPRGGTNGTLVDGKFVTRQLSSRAKAEEIAEQIRNDLLK